MKDDLKAVRREVTRTLITAVGRFIDLNAASAELVTVSIKVNADLRLKVHELEEENERLRAELSAREEDASVMANEIARTGE